MLAPLSRSEKKNRGAHLCYVAFGVLTMCFGMVTLSKIMLLGLNTKYLALVLCSSETSDRVISQAKEFHSFLGT